MQSSFLAKIISFVVRCKEDKHVDEKNKMCQPFEPPYHIKRSRAVDTGRQNSIYRSAKTISNSHVTQGALVKRRC